MAPRNPNQPDTPADVTVRNAELQYINFEGRATRFKPAGESSRGFRLMLPEDVARDMADAGWNVKETKPWREASVEEVENFVPRPFLDVKVNFEYESKAPQIQLVTGEVRTLLSRDTAFIVDQSDIVKIDLIINASYYDFGGNQGFAAYLKKAYITIQEDDLEQDYAHIPLAGTTRIA
jgi:hypothetical protein